MIKTLTERCTGITASSNTRCRNRSVAGEKLCKYHSQDPFWIKWRSDSGRRGAMAAARGIRMRINNFKMKDPRDSKRFIGKLIEEVGTGKLVVAPKDFSGLAKLLEQFNKASEQEKEIYDEMDLLKKEIAKLKQTN